LIFLHFFEDIFEQIRRGSPFDKGSYWFWPNFFLFYTFSTLRIEFFLILDRVLNIFDLEKDVGLVDFERRWFVLVKAVELELLFILFNRCDGLFFELFAVGANGALEKEELLQRNLLVPLTNNVLAKES
jgi:hypothetical protein